MTHLPSPATSNQVQLLLKPKDAAEMLQISERKLWALTDEGAITALWIGRAKRYDLRDLISYIDGLKTKGGSHAAP